MRSQLALARRAGGNHGTAHEDLSFVDAELGTEEGTPGRTRLALGVGGLEHGDLRRRLGHPVNLDDGRAAAGRLLDHIDRNRAARP